VHQTSLNKEAKRPIDRWRRRFSSLFAEAGQNLVGADGLVTLPDQSQNAPP